MSLPLCTVALNSSMSLSIFYVKMHTLFYIMHVPRQYINKPHYSDFCKTDELKHIMSRTFNPAQFAKTVTVEGHKIAKTNMFNGLLIKGQVKKCFGGKNVYWIVQVSDEMAQWWDNFVALLGNHGVCVLDHKSSAHHFTICWCGQDEAKIKQAEEALGPLEGKEVMMEVTGFLKYLMPKEDDETPRESGGAILVRVHRSDKYKNNIDRLRAVLSPERLGCEHFTFGYPKSKGPAYSNDAIRIYNEHIAQNA